MTYVCSGCGREAGTNLLPCVWCGRKAWRLVDKPQRVEQPYIPENSPWWGFGEGLAFDQYLDSLRQRGDRA